MTLVTVNSDLRQMFGPVRDQKQRPTCLAFATSDLHAALRGSWSPLSCEYLFYYAQKRAARFPDQGATLPATLQALRHDGQPGEAGWAYFEHLPADLTLWKPPSGLAGVFRRGSEIDYDTLGVIEAQLAQGRPVLTLLTISDSFYRPNTAGVIDQLTNEPPDSSRRHAVVAVGHGSINGKRAIMVRNSWGEQWALGGYGWLTERYLAPRMFSLAILKEDLSVSRNSAAA